MMTSPHDQAVQGGLQGWSVKAPYPFIVLAVDNPQGYAPGLYWYVVDSRKGSHAFNDRVGPASKGKLAAEYAHCHASALYLHHIEGVGPTEASSIGYAAYWDRVEQERTRLY